MPAPIPTSCDPSSRSEAFSVATTKVVTAGHDAEHNTLRLVEPLEGVRDHETVKVQVIAEEEGKGGEPAWMALAGSLSKEDGDELARLVNEMFPPWE